MSLVPPNGEHDQGKDSGLTARLGARPLEGGLTEFRVWATRPNSVSVRIGESELPMEHAGDGVYEVVAPARAGDDYLFLLDGQAVPDPCSRWQPYGLRGPSRVLEPPAVPRFDTHALKDLVIYELHIGTFTEEGTFEAAIPHLAELASLGVGAIEQMVGARAEVDRARGAKGEAADAVELALEDPGRI